MAEEFKHTLPKSPMGEALQYTIPRWDNLLAYLYDGIWRFATTWLKMLSGPMRWVKKITCSPDCTKRLKGQLYFFFAFSGHARGTKSIPLNG